MFAAEQIGDLSDIAGVDDYLDKMDGAIDRAVIRICQAKKAGLEKKVIYVVDEKDSESDDYANQYTLDEIAEGIDLGTNVFAVDRVAMYSKIKRNNISFDMVDYKTILLDPYWLKVGQKYIVYYYPSTVEIPIADDVEITSLREDVQKIIPYFVKAEVYEEDEASLAAQARNMFESLLGAIEMNTQTVQQKVVDVWRL